MKRLILAAILIFPLISLLGWFYWGATHQMALPTAPDAGTNLPVITTNSTAEPPAGAPVK